MRTMQVGDSDNHIQRKRELDALAARIRKEISTSDSEICVLGKGDLASIWLGDQALSNVEKRVCVNKFLLQYGFEAMIDSEFSSAVFRNSN